jgi:hypothetical protein
MQNNTATTRSEAQARAALRDRIARAQRRPLRISATISGAVYERLQERATVEGRSLSNLAAYLLEMGVTSERGW